MEITMGKSRRELWNFFTLAFLLVTICGSINAVSNDSDNGSSILSDKFDAASDSLDSNSCQCGIFLMDSPNFETLTIDGTPVVSGNPVAANCSAQSDKISCASTCQKLVHVVATKGEKTPLVHIVAEVATRTLVCQILANKNRSGKSWKTKALEKSSLEFSKSKSSSKMANLLSGDEGKKDRNVKDGGSKLSSGVKLNSMGPKWMGGFYRWCDSDSWTYTGISVPEPLCCLGNEAKKCPDDGAELSEDSRSLKTDNDLTSRTGRQSKFNDSEEVEDDEEDQEKPEKPKQKEDSDEKEEDSERNEESDPEKPKNSTKTTSSTPATEKSQKNKEKAKPEAAQKPKAAEKKTPEKSTKSAADLGKNRRSLNSTILAEAFQFIGVFMRSIGYGDVANGILHTFSPSTASVLLERADFVGDWVWKYQDKYTTWPREFNLGYCYVEYMGYNLATEGIKNTATNLYNRIFKSSGGKEKQLHNQKHSSNQHHHHNNKNQHQHQNLNFNQHPYQFDQTMGNPPQNTPNSFSQLPEVQIPHKPKHKIPHQNKHNNLRENLNVPHDSIHDSILLEKQTQNEHDNQVQKNGESIVPKNSGAAEISGFSGIPEIPKIPKIPELPKFPEIPGIPTPAPNSFNIHLLNNNNYVPMPVYRFDRSRHSRALNISNTSTTEVTGQRLGQEGQIEEKTPALNQTEAEDRKIQGNRAPGSESTGKGQGKGQGQFKGQDAENKEEGDSDFPWGDIASALFQTAMSSGSTSDGDKMSTLVQKAAPMVSEVASNSPMLQSMVSDLVTSYFTPNRPAPPKPQQQQSGSNNKGAGPQNGGSTQQKGQGQGQSSQSTKPSNNNPIKNLDNHQLHSPPPPVKTRVTTTTSTTTESPFDDNFSHSDPDDEEDEEENSEFSNTHHSSNSGSSHHSHKDTDEDSDSGSSGLGSLLGTLLGAASGGGGGDSSSGMTGLMGQLVQSGIKSYFGFGDSKPSPSSSSRRPVNSGNNKLKSGYHDNDLEPTPEPEKDIATIILDFVKPLFISLFGVTPDVPGFGQLSASDRRDRGSPKDASPYLTNDPDVVVTQSTGLADLFLGSPNIPDSGNMIYDFGNRMVYFFGRANDPLQGLYCFKQYTANKVWDYFSGGVRNLLK